MRKKKILIHSNFCKAFTGFGKHKKNILKYLANTDKYEIFEAANGKIKGDPSLNSLPWKCYGTVPANYNSLQGDEKKKAGYGQLEIANIIKEVEPDVYIGIEDIWGFSDLPNQAWWKNINKMIWTTLDSLPILEQAIDFAPKLEHYYVWASFAEKAMNDIGYDNVKTLRGSIDTSNFFRLSDEKRLELRKKHKINKDDYIVGFVFRNQLRKSVPNLLTAFKKLKSEIPNAKLLLHTHWAEGWDIPRLLEEHDIDNSDVLTTYFCKNCKSYMVQSFIGQGKDCNRCGAKKTVNTANINHGVSEQQLNEVYNLMDVYCHPFTSGGQEIPIQEAKLTELITLVTNYSCGEDNCTPESGGLELNWHEYREPGTQFIKASTCPESIYEKLKQVYEMNEDDRVSIGKKARQWVIDNFSVEVIGKKLEEIIDGMPFIENFDFTAKDLNEKHEFKNDLSNEEFILDLYENIIFDSVDKNSSGFKIWLSKLENKETDKKAIYNHFIKVAKETNAKRKSRKDFGSLFSEEDEGRRVAVVIPKSSTDVLLINSLIKKLKYKHKKHNIYVLTERENFQYIEDNPDVYQCLSYAENIDNPRLLEGAGENKGFFEFAYFPHATTQKFPCYIHNGK